LISEAKIILIDKKLASVMKHLPAFLFEAVLAVEPRFSIRRSKAAI
jgi:hypothetical protein